MSVNLWGWWLISQVPYKSRLWSRTPRASTYFRMCKFSTKTTLALNNIQARVYPSQSDNFDRWSVKRAHGAVSPDLLGAKVIVQGWVLSGVPARLVCVTVYCEETSRSDGKRGYASCLLITTHRSELGLSCPRPHSVLKTRICASSNAAGLCWTPSGGPFFVFFLSFCHNHNTAWNWALFSFFFSLVTFVAISSAGKECHVANSTITYHEHSYLSTEKG